MIIEGLVLAAENEPGTVAGWPAGVEEISYLSTADKTMQPALFYNPKRAKPVPLLVALHTWSYGYLQPDYGSAYVRWSIQEGWAFIHPHFRGPNTNPQACGSELAVRDILSAVEYIRKTVSIDSSRIYLIGFSGGGHMALLMAGRASELWAGVSAWCGIYDLSTWHLENVHNGKKTKYAIDLENVCGGVPGSSSQVDQEYRQRSPAAWLTKARDVPLDINAGIKDGHNNDGPVPVSHSLRAFNALAAPAEQITDNDITAITAEPRIPGSICQTIEDDDYPLKSVLYRRVSGNTRVTIFQGGHQILHTPALRWLARQKKGTSADWNITYDEEK
jgi:pimeloyl-ACP methyl ester carboxylesterase